MKKIELAKICCNCEETGNRKNRITVNIVVMWKSQATVQKIVRKRIGLLEREWNNMN